jgi:hypothetical protein
MLRDVVAMYDTIKTFLEGAVLRFPSMLDDLANRYELLSARSDSTGDRATNCALDSRSHC